MKEIREKYKAHCDKLDEIVECVNKTTELITELVELGETGDTILDAMIVGIFNNHKNVIDMFVPDDEDEDIYG